MKIIFRQETVNELNGYQGYLEVGVPREELEVDLLLVAEIDPSHRERTAGLYLNKVQWAELAEFARQRAALLEAEEGIVRDEETPPTMDLKHYTYPQVVNREFLKKARSFEERVNLARMMIYEAGDLGEASYRFDAEILEELVSRNEALNSGIKVGDHWVYKLTPKGKNEHRRYTDATPASTTKTKDTP